MRLLIDEERTRQRRGLEMIASENFVSKSVSKALGSCFTNKYAEGYPGRRYYGGNEVVDDLERLCQKRALLLFGLDPLVWGVNVQPYSGSPANLAVYAGLLEPHDRLMGLDLPSGGHLTHGYMRKGRAVSKTAEYYTSLAYRLDPKTGLIDYDDMATTALRFRPKLLICGASAYPRKWDYTRFRRVADKVDAYLMADMAHVAGLVAVGEAQNPFEVCDVVTTTTHKTLRGPRAALIFYRKDERNLGRKIDSAVFPGLQGGPHLNTIAAVAVALHEAAQPEFKTYIQQVKRNADALVTALKAFGYTIATGGTDNHLLLLNLRSLKLTGSKLEKCMELASMSVNKNTIYGDTNPMVPYGVRIGTPALTTRGMNETDMAEVARYIHEAITLALQLQQTSGPKLRDFEALAKKDTALARLKAQVERFARGFDLPG